MDFDFLCFCVFARDKFDHTIHKKPMLQDQVLCVFVFFSIQCRKWPSQVFCVFLCFFGQKLRPGHTTHVFDVFLCFLISRGYGNRHVFCVFFWQIWFRPSHNTDVFYVFLCFFLISAKIAQPCILCVFVFFWLEVQTRSNHPRV